MWLIEPNTLSETQMRELNEIITTTRDSKIYRRAKVILYRNAGYTADEIQEYTEYSERAQQYWLSRYREEGEGGLYERPRSGRPPQKTQRASVEQKALPKAEQKAPPKAEQKALPKAEQKAPPKAEQKAPPKAEQKAPPKAEQKAPPKAEQKAPPTRPQLDYWGRLTLEQMQANHPNPYLRDRAQMVLLRDNGYSAADIAEILDVHIGTVYRGFRTYDRDKLAGLYRKPGSGRVSQLGAQQWKQVAERVQKGPKSLGYRFVKWTTRSLRKYIYKRFNVLFCREWIRQKLHQFLNYSWTRGKKVYAYPENTQRNTERNAFALKMLAYLEQAHRGEIILLFEDESIFSLFGEVGYSWSPVGTTQEVPSAGKRGRVVVFGASDPHSGRTHYRIEDDSINQESTLRFLTQLVRYYQQQQPGIPLIIVLDKHPGHTSGLVDEFVNEHEHVTLENPPTQSPDLNPQEHIWDWLEEQMIKNEFFETKDALKKAIRHFFCYLSGIKEQVIRCLGNLQKLYSTEVIVDAVF